MKSLLWAAVALAGFGLMLVSYLGLIRIADPTPWTDAFMFVGLTDPVASSDIPKYSQARLRYLLGSGLLNETDLGQAAAQSPALGKVLQGFREKIVFDPSFANDFTPEMLAEGRMPQPGAGEAVAGANAAGQGQIVLDGATIRIVGRFRRSVGLFADTYVMPLDVNNGRLYLETAQNVSTAYIFRMSADELRDPAARRRLLEAFPRGRFTPVAADVRVDAGPYFMYLGGMAVFLLGGSVLFVRLYGWLAGVVRWAALRRPLETLHRWRRLLLGLHAVFFGMFILTAAAIYFVPSVQSMLVRAVQDEVRDGRGPLGFAGQAYLSGSIPGAAAATLAVNFFLGTVATISLPSAVVPGLGSLFMFFRSTVVGLLLAPSSVRMAGMMMPHSVTMLVELEAYIVAAFFALMIPIYLFRPAEGPTVLGRYGRALLLNAQALLPIAVILAVVAVYEAIEVILQVG
jgi:hypothetical protein